ncbi:MAG: hypothetical protein HYR87_07385 [Thaumarchaeota archaeon]|nr:hypothetical protein [Nitrososphaerota archaeon]
MSGRHQGLQSKKHMFEVIIDKKKYTNQEIESVTVYSEDEHVAHAWVTFKKDVSNLVGLPISISSSSVSTFTGQVDSIESQTEYVCKLYCIGYAQPSSENAKVLSPIAKKERNPSKIKS